MTDVTLLPGETVRHHDKSGLRVVLKNFAPEGLCFVASELLLTNARLLFPLAPSSPYKGPISVHLASIDAVTSETIQARNKEPLMHLELSCRDLQVVLIIFHNPNNAKQLLNVLSSHRAFSSRLPFDHFEALLRDNVPPVSGFGTYSVRADFSRMGIPDASLVLNDRLNANFTLCSSYPQVVCTPSSVPDATIAKSSAFRCKNRFPVVIFRGEAGGILMRSSQPLVGVGRARCEEDEQLLKVVSDMNQRSKVLMICDARPRINAIANQATTSGGCENTTFYPFAVLHFGNVENIHHARSTFEKLLQVLTSKCDDLDDFDRKVRGSGWQKNLHTILMCARTVADWILEGKSALVHCSDGWDRTPQVTSLCQLMLDPFYRTLEGFAILVEKDWISYGHMFVLRHGQMMGDDQKYKERAPIFLQFLACVWHLTQQFPCAFEFNGDFLLDLHRRSVSGIYGTFCVNGPRDRADFQMHLKTVAVWDSFLDPGAVVQKQYLNPLYKVFPDPALWDPHYAMMSLWHQCYLWPLSAYKISTQPKQELQAVLDSIIRDKLEVVEERAALLEKRSAALAGKHPEMNEMLEKIEQLERRLKESEKKRMQEAIDSCMDRILDLAWKEYEAMTIMNSFGQLSMSGSSARSSMMDSGIIPPSAEEPSEEQPPVQRPQQSTSASSLPKKLPPPPSKRMSTAMWVPDSLAEACALCSAKFTWSLRIHHCRQCGNCFCNSCSSNRMLLDGVSSRVCDTCFTNRFLKE